MTSAIDDPKVSASRSMRWLNPFRKAFGKMQPAVPTVRRVPDGNLGILRGRYSRS